MRINLVIIFLLSLFIVTSVNSQTHSVKSYGMSYAPADKFAEMKSWGINTVFQVIIPSDTVTKWNVIFDSALQYKMKLIIILWPMPYKWNGNNWDLSPAKPFFDYLRNNLSYLSTLQAICPDDEPYFRNGSPYPWTTPQLIRLRTAIRAELPGMKIFYNMGSLKYWDDKARREGKQTWVSDSAYDICSVYKHTVDYDSAGIYKVIYDSLVEASIISNRRLLDGNNMQKRRQNIELFYSIHTFDYPSASVRMPSYSELKSIGKSAAESGMLDGLLFYPWKMSYPVNLTDRDDLIPLVSIIWQKYVKQQLEGQYSLDVHDGYGSGMFTEGDTVHIWSKDTVQNVSFMNWSGNITLKGKDEWHTSFIMPKEPVSVTANYYNIIPFSFRHENIKCVENIKNVYYCFPPVRKGVIFCFHGTGGNAGNWLDKAESFQFLRDAVSDSFGIVITEAEEVTLDKDLDNDGKIRWSPFPLDISNIDIGNIKALIDTFQTRGITSPNTFYFALGMSNGGTFCSAVSPVLGFRGEAIYCASGNKQLFSQLNIPTIWNMAKYDDNENVGQQGNIAAMENYYSLKIRGIRTEYNVNDHSPVYSERFRRCRGISAALSDSLFSELAQNNLLDEDNYLKFSTDSISKMIQNKPGKFQYFLSLDAMQKSWFAEQCDVMLAAHRFFSDYNRKTLAFFTSIAYSLGIETTIHLDSAELKIEPNPATDYIFIKNYRNIKGNVRIYSLLGSLMLEAEANEFIDVRCLPKGMYFICMNNTIIKFLKF